MTRLHLWVGSPTAGGTCLRNMTVWVRIPPGLPIGILVCYNRYMSTKYSKEVIERAVANSESLAGVLRYLGLKQAGGTQTHIRNKIKKFDIDTSHFLGQGHNRARYSGKRKTCEEILVVLPEGSGRPKVAQLRRAMLECGVEYKCVCGLTDEWAGSRLVLEVDHINGDWLDNRLENLRFLCPNCHSQTPTSRSWKNGPLAQR